MPSNQFPNQHFLLNLRALVYKKFKTDNVDVLTLTDLLKQIKLKMIVKQN